MIEGNPFVDTDSMVPEKGGAAVKSAARSNGNRIANFNWDEAFKGFVELFKGGMEMASNIVASKNGAAAATTPTVAIQKKDNTATWVLVGVVVVALVVGLLFFMKRRK